MAEPLATFVDTLIRWLTPAYQHTGYLIVAVAVLLERSLFIGLIVPGDVILAVGGVFAAKGDLTLPLVIVIGMLAATAGESIGYWLGRRFGFALIARIPVLRRFEPRIRAAEGRYFHGRGAGPTVAIGRYATAAGAFIPFTAGLGGMPYRRFLLWDVPAIALWATGITMFGYAFGRRLDVVDRVLSRFGYVMLGVLIGFLGGRWLWKRYRRRPPPRPR
jgi:undecaprenyl-diphosphatase